MTLVRRMLKKKNLLKSTRVGYRLCGRSFVLESHQGVPNKAVPHFICSTEGILLAGKIVGVPMSWLGNVLLLKASAWN